MLNVFCSPARYVQGPDASRHLAPEMRKLGIAERPLIIASPSAWRQLAAIWGETFAAAQVNIHHLVFGGECSFPEIERCKEEAQRTRAGVIIGAGGARPWIPPGRWPAN